MLPFTPTEWFLVIYVQTGNSESFLPGRMSLLKSSWNIWAYLPTSWADSLLQIQGFKGITQSHGNTVWLRRPLMWWNPMLKLHQCVLNNQPEPSGGYRPFYRILLEMRQSHKGDTSCPEAATHPVPQQSMEKQGHFAYLKCLSQCHLPLWWWQWLLPGPSSATQTGNRRLQRRMPSGTGPAWSSQ